MSRRAHRLNSINYEKSESFNLSHDEELKNYLDERSLLENLNSDNSGIIDVSIMVLKDAIKDVKLENSTKKALREDIKWAKDNDEEFVQYYCF